MRLSRPPWGAAIPAQRGRTDRTTDTKGDEDLTSETRKGYTKKVVRSKITLSRGES